MKAGGRGGRRPGSEALIGGRQAPSARGRVPSGEAQRPLVSSVGVAYAHPSEILFPMGSYCA